MCILIILTELFAAQQPASGPGPSHYLDFTITLRHITLGRTALEEWSARHRDLYLTAHTKHTGERHSYTDGNRTRNPSKRAAADPCLIPLGHWDRQAKRHQLEFTIPCIDNVIWFSCISWLLKMGPIDFPEASVRNYHHTLQNRRRTEISTHNILEVRTLHCKHLYDGV